MTQRFDRDGNHKIHVQTLNGIAHVDYKKPGSFSYAELFGIARELRLPASAAHQLFKRMTFNIIARNHDDHRSEEHTSELQSRFDLVCRRLLLKTHHARS